MTQKIFDKAKKLAILLCCSVTMCVLTACGSGRVRTSKSDFKKSELKEAKISARTYLEENYPEHTFDIKIILSGPGTGPVAAYSIDCLAKDENDHIYYGMPIGETDGKRWRVGDNWDFEYEEFDLEYWDKFKDLAPKD